MDCDDRATRGVLSPIIVDRRRGSRAARNQWRRRGSLCTRRSDVNDRSGLFVV